MFFTLLFISSVLSAADDPVIAEVNDDVIRRSDFDRAWAVATENRKIAPQAAAVLQRAVVVRLIDERLVQQALARQDRLQTPAEVEVAIGRLEAKLKERGATLTGHLKERGQTRDAFAIEVRRQISWQRYVEEKTTDENLQKYFAKFHREFDGTQLRVAHILWKLPEPCSAAEVATAKEQAADVHRQIVAGKLTFAAAARTHSQAPTATEGGDIGWISRREPMSEAFSKAAFALQPGAIGEPIVSPAGVHLIHCLEEKQGRKQWTDVILELRPAVAQYLFEALVRQERDQRSPKIRIIGESLAQP